MRPLIFTRNGSLKPRLIGRVHSKSCHSGRALTQVIILQLPPITPEGVTLYICTLFGCPSGARTQDTAVNSRMLVPTELRGNIKSFLFSYLIYYNIFFLKNQKRFFSEEERKLSGRVAYSYPRDLLSHPCAGQLVCNCLIQASTSEYDGRSPVFPLRLRY